MNINQALENANKSVLTAPLVVTISAVYKRKAKEGQFPGFVQGLKVVDASGECYLNVHDKEEIPQDIVGSMYEFSSYCGQRGWAGLVVEEYPVGTKKLKLTKTGSMKLHVINNDNLPTNQQDSEYEQEQPKQELKPENKPIIIQKIANEVKVTDWDSKERRELAGKAWNSAFMTIYPIMSKEVDSSGNRKHTDAMIKDVCNYFAGWQMKELYNEKFYKDEPLPF